MLESTGERISGLNVIAPTSGTTASSLAVKYVETMYYVPVEIDGKISLEKLDQLLAKATITWIRNGKKEVLTLDEMNKKLLRGYYYAMKEIEVLNSSFGTDRMAPKAMTQTVQVWDGVLKNRPSSIRKQDLTSEEKGPYRIDSSIFFEVQKDEETNAYFISGVVHEYTSRFIGNEVASTETKAAGRWWLLGY